MLHTATLSHKQEMTNQLLVGAYLCDKVAVCDMHIAQLHTATWSRDKVARQNRAKNRRCNIGLTLAGPTVMPACTQCWQAL